VKHLAAIAVVVVAALSCGAASACTSFAAYGDTTYYGMNFDYGAEFPLRLHVDSPEGGPVFHLAFERDGRPVRTAGMNSRGLMSAVQELYPPRPGTSAEGPGELYIWRVYFEALAHFDRAEDVATFVGTRRLIQPSAGPNLHAIVADPAGTALVVEPGEERNAITTIDGGYIVMTNFPVCALEHSAPEEIPGVGIDRYVAARDYLEEHAESLDLEGAFEVLERTSWTFTRASMVFAPESGEVYVAFDRDYDKVYRISLASRTVETYRGFAEPATWRIGPRGLAAAALNDPHPGLVTRVRRWLGL